MLAARTFGAGFATVEFAASALVDMAYHARPEAPAEPLRFEAETLEKLGMPEAIPMRHRTPHFGMCSPATAIQPATIPICGRRCSTPMPSPRSRRPATPSTRSLPPGCKRHIYSAGGSRDPEELYIAFRGKMPTPDAMMVKRGLA